MSFAPEAAANDLESLRRRAQQGEADAQYIFYYWRSYGGPQDKVEALKWILIAERGGNKDAPNLRASMLRFATEHEGEDRGEVTARRSYMRR